MRKNIPVKASGHIFEKNTDSGAILQGRHHG
jgi:hypothetical protein